MRRDKSHIHQAYDGFCRAGLWARPNSDGGPFAWAVLFRLPKSPHKHQADWLAGNDELGYPPGDPSRVLGPLGAIAEMSDRTHGNNWSPDLPAAFYPLQRSP